AGGAPRGAGRGGGGGGAGVWVRAGARGGAGEAGDAPPREGAPAPPLAVVVPVEAEVEPRAELHPRVAEHLDLELALGAVGHAAAERAAEEPAVARVEAQRGRGLDDRLGGPGGGVAAGGYRHIVATRGPHTGEEEEHGEQEA